MSEGDLRTDHTRSSCLTLLERLRVLGGSGVVCFDNVPETRSFIPPPTPTDRTATPWPSGRWIWSEQTGLAQPAGQPGTIGSGHPRPLVPIR